jgi:4-amino-4-deoxy-L-arabinose transferase-like glycosyltransferase
MKRILSLIPGSIFQFMGLALMLFLYWWAAQLAGPPGGKELYLLETAREALYNQRFYYPTYNEALHPPVAPLLAVVMSVIFKLFSVKVLLARAVVLLLAILSVVIFYFVGARLLNATVGALAAGLLIATWGFFTNSHIVNGAMLYFSLVIFSFLLFYHWYDSAYRSRTFARSLLYHFILLGIALGLAFCTYGIPGILFPVLIMFSTLAIANKLEMLADIRYPWLLMPLAVVVFVWMVLGVFAIGPVSFLNALFTIRPGFSYLWEPLTYFLPVLPLFLPAMFAKDIWGRALLTHYKSLFLMVSWLAWSLIFLVLCPELHEAFSLLAIAPAVLWLGYYLGEVFRNPLVPFSLQLVVDGIILVGLVVSVCFILLTFQIVPKEMMQPFVVLSFSLPLISIVLLLLRDFTISRLMPLYLIPCAVFVCILAKVTIEPLIQFQPDQELYRHLSMQELADPNAAILQWGSENGPSMIRFITPLKNKITSVNDQAQLEALIQTRTGLLYLVLPEEHFYTLPYSVRQMGYIQGVSWQWRQPLTLSLLIDALRNETMDFEALTEPVFLFKVPVELDT